MRETSFIIGFMSDFLETIGDGSQWERFYEYCEAGEHATKQELSELRQFIDCGSFLTWDENFRQGKPFRMRKGRFSTRRERTKSASYICFRARRGFF